MGDAVAMGVTSIPLESVMSRLLYTMNRRMT